MTKGRPFSIYCIILFLCTEARKNNHILLQRGVYLSQKWSTAPFLSAGTQGGEAYGLCVLYDTAARVSEICSLRIEDVRFENPPHIRIMGKGMKVRAVPILPATAKKRKNPAANGKLAARKLKTFWKQQDLFCFFSKKIAPSPAKFQKSAEKWESRWAKPPQNGWTTL